MSCVNGDGGGFSTRAVHSGQPPDALTGAVVPNIVMASTFAQRSPGVPFGADSALSYGHGFEYSRTNNPTRAALELCVKGITAGAEFAVAFARYAPSRFLLSLQFLPLVLSFFYVSSLSDSYFLLDYILIYLYLSHDYPALSY